MADFRKLARRAALKHGIDPDTFERQIGAESAFNPHALSPAGARGIAQFMPGTAAGLGVNPDDPVQALNGAARLMASYVRKYGSYRDALVAYNAGPGRVGKALPAETQAYIAKILGGHEPSRSSRPGATSLSQQMVSAPTVTQPDTVKLALANLLAGQGQNAHNNPLFATGLLSTDPQLMTQTVKAADAGTGPATLEPASIMKGTDKAAGAPKDLFELFWQGKGGIDVKYGQHEPQGFVSGHTDHVHVAASPRRLLALGHMAQQMGLHVGENPHFGGVHPVHVKGSFHYKGEAIDVSGNPTAMRRYAHKVAARFGVR